MKLSSSSKGYLLVALSGVFYGMSGLFVESLSAFHIPTSVMGFFRPFIAFIVFFLFLLIKKRSYLKIDPKGLASIALIGFTSQALFNRLYFTTIQRTTIATAVVLLYTAPIFVVILARILYKEPLNPPKISALIVSVVGCFLTATGGSLEVLRLNGAGLLFGLGSGFIFALTPLLNKSLVKRYHYWTIACYTMGFGSLFTLITIDPREIFLIDYNLKILSNLTALALLANALASLLYVMGMSKDIQSSKASIINTVEVPVAVLISFIFFRENILGLKLIGILLVILSVVILEYGEQVVQSLKSKTKEGLVNHRIP